MIHLFEGFRIHLFQILMSFSQHCCISTFADAFLHQNGQAWLFEMRNCKAHLEYCVSAIRRGFLRVLRFRGSRDSMPFRGVHSKRMLLAPPLAAKISASRCLAMDYVFFRTLSATLICARRQAEVFGAGMGRLAVMQSSGFAGRSYLHADLLSFPSTRVTRE